jgi:Predicted integral membrane protein (DUF2269)
MKHSVAKLSVAGAATYNILAGVQGLAPIQRVQLSARGMLMGMPGGPTHFSRLYASTTEENKKLSGDFFPLPTESIDHEWNQEKRKSKKMIAESSFLASTSSVSNSKEEKDDSSLKEIAGVGTLIASLSAFLLVNNFVGPWPAAMFEATPVKAFGLTHALGGMLFGGGIIITTLLEWLAVSSKDPSVLKFYFDKVPKLDAFVVLPALAASIFSGVGLAVDHYGSLGESPFHVVGAISTLLIFAIWWAVTDASTQEAANNAIEEWVATLEKKDDYLTSNSAPTEFPAIVSRRRISNIVSCMFVAAIYAFMVLKPGYIPETMT